jgi:hypothetical protein
LSNGLSAGRKFPSEDGPAASAGPTFNCIVPALEIPPEGCRARNFLELLPLPKFAAGRVVLGHEDYHPLHPLPPEAFEALLDQRLPETAATKLPRDGEMVEKPAVRVVAAEHGADHATTVQREPAQAWIAPEKGCDALPVVSLGDFHTLGLLPQRHDRVVVGLPDFTKLDSCLHIPITEYSLNGMQLSTLKATLLQHAEQAVRFVLPDGVPLPAHFHVTEVGHVTRRFIDCGGKIRQLESCLLQTWVADDDRDHRLTAAKLAKILEISRVVVPSDELGVEIEYDRDGVGQYTIASAESDGDVLVFTLGHKKTDCLAREVCGVEPAGAGAACCGTGCGCN